MDNNDSVKYYPRLGHDKYAARSIPIKSVTQTEITINVGKSKLDQYSLHLLPHMMLLLAI